MNCQKLSARWSERKFKHKIKKGGALKLAENDESINQQHYRIDAHKGPIDEAVQRSSEL